MIAISFIITDTKEKEATKLLQKIADYIIDNINKIEPNSIMAGTPWIFRRQSEEPGEPSIELITDTIERFLDLTARAIDSPTYQTWIFDIQSANHAIAIPNLDKPEFHIIKPNQVSSLFKGLAQTLSKLVDVEVSYNDDHTRTGIIYQHGKATKEEHW